MRSYGANGSASKVKSTESWWWGCLNCFISCLLFVQKHPNVFFSSNHSPLMYHLLDPDLVRRSLLLLHKSNPGPYFFPHDAFKPLFYYFFFPLFCLFVCFNKPNLTYAWLSLAPSFTFQTHFDSQLVSSFLQNKNVLVSAYKTLVLWSLLNCQFA